jgi:hypothetical protein
MDHIARGVASAALTLQSIQLQALVQKGVLMPAEALRLSIRASMPLQVPFEMRATGGWRRSPTTVYRTCETALLQ